MTETPDRVTQLQVDLSTLSKIYFTSLGVMQRDGVDTCRSAELSADLVSCTRSLRHCARTLPRGQYEEEDEDGDGASGKKRRREEEEEEVTDEALVAAAASLHTALVQLESERERGRLVLERASTTLREEATNVQQHLQSTAE